ncbi:MAG: T9SS type A sorting domain-containing protein, partial [Bacteroidales bacterium]|nr:T9SS type A sorting domain-containing protein [Bacteroidales bacterium]
SNAGGISAWTQVFPFISDGAEGFYIAWHDDRNSDNQSRVFVQHIASDGNAVFTANGVEASILDNRNRFYPFLSLIPGTDEVIVMWNEMDVDQNNRGIYGQKLSNTGERLWSDNGKVFLEIAPLDVYPFAIETATEDFALFYEYSTDVVNATIRTMRVDADGEYVWADESIEMCSVLSSKVHPVAGPFHSGQWIATWEDDRNGNTDIYAQNIQLNGSLGAIETGIVEISPDTLWFEENPQTLQVHIVNNSPDPYTITYMDEYGAMFWWVFPMPEIPYTIGPGDSLLVNVTFEFITTQPFGYLYDEFIFQTETDTVTTVIAINEDLTIDVQDLSSETNLIQVYPNPSAGEVYFENAISGLDTEVHIYNSNGELVKFLREKASKQFMWDGKDQFGNNLPAGKYLYSISAGEMNQSGTIILSR